jgi:hypothetical protein
MGETKSLVTNQLEGYTPIELTWVWVLASILIIFISNLLFSISFSFMYRWSLGIQSPPLTNASTKSNQIIRQSR